MQTPQLKKPSSNDHSPLANLIRTRMKLPEIQRLKKLGNLLESFHGKYAVTSKVDKRKIILNGKEVINFGSANYLGFDFHPEVITASQTAIQEWGTHAGCSRVFASHENIFELEQKLSDLVGAEKTLIGHNISQIHAGVLPALYSNKQSAIFIDRHAHMSMYQASLIAQAKGAKIIPVDISKVDKARQTILDSRLEHNVLLVDGVYSMQGHTPPLLEWDQFCKEQNTVLYIDDAHGIGIFGKNGGGVVEKYQVPWGNILVTGSLQKAFSSYGGFISGQAAIIDLIRFSSKAYIFSGTIQPSAVAGALKALQISKSAEGQALRSKLKNNSLEIRTRLNSIGYKVSMDPSPIIPVPMGSDLLTMMAGRRMFDLGMYVNSVVFPAVPHDEGVLRISVTSLHTEEEVNALIEAFSELRKYLSKYENPIHFYAHATKEIIKSKLFLDNYKGL